MQALGTPLELANICNNEPGCIGACRAGGGRRPCRSRGALLAAAFPRPARPALCGPLTHPLLPPCLPLAPFPSSAGFNTWGWIKNALRPSFNQMFDFSTFSPALNFSAEGMYVKDPSVTTGTDPGGFVPAVNISLPAAAVTTVPRGSVTVAFNFTANAGTTVACVDQAGRAVRPPTAVFPVGNHTVTCTGTNAVGRSLNFTSSIAVGEARALGACGRLNASDRNPRPHTSDLAPGQPSSP
jgi:hypothetical protein